MPNADNRYRAQSIADAFAEHRDVLAGYLARKLFRPEDVEDLLQETFYQAYQANGDQPVRSPKGYLFIVARNLVSRRFAKQAKEMTQVLKDSEFANIASQEAPLDQQLHFKIKMEIFMEALDSLPSRCRSVFLHRKIYGSSHAKIASELGISTSTVERDITLALSRLSKILKTKGYSSSQTSDSGSVGDNGVRRIRNEELAQDG